MSPLLFAALMMVLSHQPGLPISSGDTYTVREERMEGGMRVVSETVYTGFTTCEDGKVTKLVHNGTLSTFEHEVLHSSDCLDNGRVDGSLLPFRPQTTDPAHEFTGWCQDNEAKCIEILREATK